MEAARVMEAARAVLGATVMVMAARAVGATATVVAARELAVAARELAVAVMAAEGVTQMHRSFRRSSGWLSQRTPSQ
jgi:hypothetical protein